MYASIKALQKPTPSRFWLG